ncbi:LysR substrate-binding domain-containing protein [Granulosicoccus antarcticus]|uniref:Glycine cleavage system transcriptional activator n=1 Tax=Granulosicoccus antarcticus IMCC3135 TaxID=1192854 RepID=A0A2Z2NZK3_9GAMM|nr:LysR substrate-binding domain-containing protein [Granulosicoccus antarcticus]ASJ74320.1 Glycine cleavage system transcriptional activator [Granulosicoccus antarcticus IMCC3135]
MQALPLNALRVFEAVVRLGSFRAAAEELCVSQSAVSHQIRHLEEWFACPLFDRGGSRPQPLPYAEHLAATLGLNFQDMHQACQRVHRISASSTLVIAAIPSVATCWLIPRLSDFRRRHPEIDIRIIYAFHGQTIDFGEIDLAFVFAENQTQQAGTDTHLFLRGISAPVCSPAISQSLQGKSLQDVNVDIQILHDSNSSGWEQWCRKAGNDKILESAGLTFEDFNLLRAAVLSGQGVALCPLSMVQEDLAGGHLVQLSELTVMETYNYYLIERSLSNSSTQKSVDAFKNWLFEVRDKKSRTG